MTCSICLKNCTVCRKVFDAGIASLKSWKYFCSSGQSSRNEPIRLRDERQVDIVKAIQFGTIRNLTTKKRVEELAAEHHIAPTTLKRCFKSVYGSSIGQHLQELRVSEAMRMLAETEDSILQIANRVGYANSSKFSVLFQK